MPKSKINILEHSIENHSLTEKFSIRKFEFNEQTGKTAHIEVDTFSSTSSRVDQEHHLENLHEELLVSDFTTNQMKKIVLPHQRCGRNDDGIDEKTSPNTKHI